MSPPAIAWTLLRKKLGFRALLKTTPLDGSIVKGSHGRLPDDPADGPLLLGDGDRPRGMAEVKAAILAALSITDELFRERSISKVVDDEMRSLGSEIRRWLPPAKRGEEA